MKTKQKSGTTKFVLEVMKVSVESGKIKPTAKDTLAMAFLQAEGFSKLSCSHHRVEAEKNGAAIFLLDVDTSTPANKKDCKLISLRGDKFQIVDRGQTCFAPIAPSSIGTATEIDFEGQRMKNWEAHCQLANSKVLGSYDLAVKQGRVLSPQDGPPTPPVIDEPPPRIVTPTSPPSVNGPPPDEKIIWVRVDECVAFQPSPEDGISGQPRKTFNEKGIHELGKSIREDGHLTPILVKAITHIPGKKWEIIAGERRWRAHIYIDFAFMRAIVKTPRDKKEQHMMALLENLHREDPPTIEISNAYQEQINLGETITSLSLRFGKPAVEIRRALSLQLIHNDLRKLLSSEIDLERRLRPSEATALSEIIPSEQVRIWNDAKTATPRRSVVTKIKELGRNFLIKKPGRGARRNEKAVIARTVRRRLGAFHDAFIPLKGIPFEEWTQFAEIEGDEKLGADMRAFTQLLADINPIKNSISRARAAIRQTVPNKTTNGNGHK